MSADIRQVARDYIEQGFTVLPVAAGSKKCHRARWQEETFGPDDFETTDGIAGRCDSYRCVDCDEPAAIVAAQRLLPHTCVEGHVGKPDSHYWFDSADARYASYKHLKRADGSQPTIVELLSGAGRYAVLPPSVHPESRSPRTWSNTRRPKDRWLHARPHRVLHRGRGAGRSPLPGFWVATCCATRASGLFEDSRSAPLIRP